MCGLLRLEQSEPEGWFPFIIDWRLSWQHCSILCLLLYKWFLRVQSDKDASQWYGKNYLYHPVGKFYYKVKPFCLKNAGATYQRAMITLFHDMIHKEIEVYVDDMIVKSRTEDEHIDHLRKLFAKLKRYKIWLNPAKCTFGVRSNELLAFIINQRGIEFDPDKVRSIQDMPSPITEKQVRGFLGRP